MVKIRVHRVTTHTIKHMKTCHLNFIDFMNPLQTLSTHYITQLIVLMKKCFLALLLSISKFQLLNSSFLLVGTFSSIMSCFLAMKTHNFR